MPVDTKPNLNSEKFEQFSGDTLNLSGTTRIYGNIEYAGSAPINFNSNSLVKKNYVDSIVSGLTGSSVTAGNGLTKIGDNIVLGGTLTGGTNINTNTFPLLIKSSGGAIGVESYAVGGAPIEIGDTNGTYLYGGDITGGTTDYTAVSIAQSLITFDSENNGGTESVQLRIAYNDAKFVDTRSTPIGLEYGNDYSAGFTNRSLVDKAYVDNAISGLTGSSSSGDRIVKQFTQSGHTFSIGNIVEYSGSTFIKALAVSGRNSEIIGVVSQIIDANNFNVTIAGYIDGLTGLTANSTYYVSSTVAGALTTTEPTQDNTVSKPMLTTFTSSDGIVFQYRGIVNAAATSASTITTLSMGVSAISPITAGQKGRYMVGYSGILRGWTLISDQPTTIVLDVWKASNTIPTVANTIFGTKPSLTSSEINSATGLNIAVSANDVFILNVDSNNNANYIKLDLQITQE